MPKRRKPDVTSIRVGDFLHLQVPPNRHLATGSYRAIVESLAAKVGRSSRMDRLYCAIEVNGRDFDADDAVLIRFDLHVPRKSPELAGQCFLGPDQFPVKYSHEQNLEKRLADSLPTAKERLPYADD